MKVHILLCDDFEGILPSGIPSYPWMFETLIDAVLEGVEYEVYPVHKGSLPESKDDGLYLITGSRAGSYDTLPWIAPLEEFIRTAHENRRKLVGICFGHQIVAQALGGRVEKSPKGWGVGIKAVSVLHPRAGRFFPGASFNLVYSHQDQVTLPPGEAEIFAESEFCPCAGFTVGDHILTFQGHPEFSPDYSRYLLDVHGEDIPEPVRAEARASYGQPIHHREAARWMVSLRQS